MTSRAIPIAMPSARSGPFQRGAGTAPRRPAITSTTSSTSGSRRAICCRAVIVGGSSPGAYAAKGTLPPAARNALRDEDDLASQVALGELGVGSADLVERERLGQRYLQFLGRGQVGEFGQRRGARAGRVALDLDPVLCRGVEP